MNDVFSVIRKLKNANIYFTLSEVRDNSVMVLAVVPGQRWEIEVFEDGTLEIEVFYGDGKILDGNSLDEMVAKCSR